MENTERLEMRIGLLVVAGVAALVVLILATDRIRWDDTYDVTAYMSDAGGLNVGSPVKLAGITIGSVQSIEPSADPRGQIKAELSIDRKFTIDRSSQLKNQPSGIFGDNVLTFSPPVPAADDPLPKDDSAEVETSETFLVQAAAQAEHIMQGLVTLLGPDAVQEMRGLVTNASALTGQGTELTSELRARADQLGQTLESVERLSDNLRENQENLSGQVTMILAELQVSLQSLRGSGESLAADVGQIADGAQDLMASTTRVVNQSETLLEERDEDLSAIIADLRGLAGSLHRLAVGAEHGRGVIGQLLTNDAMAKDINDATITAAQVAERIADQPEILVWGTSKEERAEAARAREARKVRRAFMQGFAYRDPPPEADPVIRSDQLEPMAAPPVDPPPVPADPDADGL
jgi:phospholipid/cholesterol/gamma-HCH transport system substrate-binding protein